MKILGYEQGHALSDFALTARTLPTPEPGPRDLLVRIRAISVNPVDYKIRTYRSTSAPGRPVILGWDAAGIVEKVGSAVRSFRPGDAVFYAGDLNRDGSYAELQTVDERIVAKKPETISFAEAAALPLTSLTAWEALLSRGFFITPDTKILIIGGAGGVGSIATQLLKATTKATVIATASRPDTIAWCRDMGADHVIDHRMGLAEELARIGAGEVDIVFGTTHSDEYLDIIPKILRPFGHFCLIDDPDTLDVSEFKSKAQSVHWEFMFAKTTHGHALETQGEILRKVAELVDAKRIRSTCNLILNGFDVGNLRRAHELLESSKAIGKIAVDFG